MPTVFATRLATLALAMLLVSDFQPSVVGLSTPWNETGDLLRNSAQDRTCCLIWRFGRSQSPVWSACGEEGTALEVILGWNSFDWVPHQLPGSPLCGRDAMAWRCRNCFEEDLLHLRI